MNPHVTSLELSQSLKALDVPQKSIFCWQGTELTHSSKGADTRDWSKVENVECVSAYLSSELGELLPLFHLLKKGPDYFRAYSKLSKENDYFMFDASTQPEAMGKLLEYLITQGIVNFKPE